MGRAGRGPPTFWLLWAVPISGPPTFLGDVNFFFLYIAIIMTGEKLRLNVPRMPQMAEIHQNSFGGRAPPEPAEGAYSAPQTP